MRDTKTFAWPKSKVERCHNCVRLELKRVNTSNQFSTKVS